MTASGEPMRDGALARVALGEMQGVEKKAQGARQRVAAAGGGAMRLRLRTGALVGFCSFSI